MVWTPFPWRDGGDTSGQVSDLQPGLRASVSALSGCPFSGGDEEEDGHGISEIEMCIYL